MRIFRDLAGLGIQLAEELLGEMGEPDHALVIDDDVVRLDLLARQIVFGDDDAGRAAGRARQRLERIVPGFVLLRLTEARYSAIAFTPAAWPSVRRALPTSRCGCCGVLPG